MRVRRGLYIPEIVCCYAFIHDREEVCPSSFETSHTDRLDNAAARLQVDGSDND